MDEEIERLVVSVRADTAGFARDVSAMRGELEGPLAQGVSRAGRMIENSLSRAIISGKFGFDDLKRVALSAMAQIASASMRSLFRSGPGEGVGSGMLNAISSLVTSMMGSPGRATGGPVQAGRSYVVGERGPELFVPASGGRIETGGGRGRDVRVSIAVTTPAPGDPQLLRRSSRQLARAVRSAIRADAR